MSVSQRLADLGYALAAAEVAPEPALTPEPTPDPKPAAAEVAPEPALDPLDSRVALTDIEVVKAAPTMADAVNVGLDENVQAVKDHFDHAAPDSLPNPTSHVKGIPGGPTQPSLDTDKFDDFGHEKKDGPVGPRGHSLPQDSMLAEDRAAAAAKSEDDKKELYASTATQDSRGDQKGTFAVTPQGHDKHGMRIPDKVDYSKPVEPPAQHGPRGNGAPKDSFHG